MSKYNNELLNEAISDARAVKELAFENAKEYLIETFSPQIMSVIKSKLDEEEFEDDEEMNDDEDAVEEADVPDDPEKAKDPEIPSGDYMDDDEYINQKDQEEVDDLVEIELTEDDDEDAYADEEDFEDDDTEDVAEQDEPAEDDEDEFELSDDEVDELLNLNNVRLELEQELEDEEDDDLDMGIDDEVPADDMDVEPEFEDGSEDEEPEFDVSDDDDEVYEITLDEEDDELEPDEDEFGGESDEDEDDMEEAYNKLKVNYEAVTAEREEFKSAVTELRNSLHEVNLLNSKLLYTNKLTRLFDLSRIQKERILETMDRAQSVREVKMAYVILAESFKDTSTVKRKHSIKKITESASRVTKKTETPVNNKQIITEVDESIKRMQQLAGIKKK